MAAWEVALLLSWLSCCGSALWRYYTRSPSYAIFSIRSTIKLEYEGTDFSEWIVPETCSIQDKRSPRTELRCSSPGFQAIRPVVTGPVKEERNLFVTESHICFFWYFTIKNLFVNFTQLITIWVYDPENAGPDELLMTAEEPSLNSLVLSKQLAILGQKPTIYTFLQKNVYYSYESHRKGIWHMIIPMTSDDVIKEIKGNQVVFQDCFIADGLFLMTFPTSTIPEHPAFLPLSSPPGSQIISTWVACIPSSVVVVTEMETFQTLDSFRTWSKVRVPPNVLSDSERHNVSKVELSSDGIFFLINGVLYLRNSYLLMKLGREYNLPDEIIGIRARKWCWVKYIFKNEVEKSSLIIWTKDEVYLGYTKLKFIQIGTISKLKSLVNMSPTATLTIHNAEYTGHPVEFAVFLSYCTACTVTKRIYTVIYNEDLREWIYQDFKLDVPVNSFLVPYFLFSAMPEVVLSDGHRIYYCYQNFTVCGIIQTATGSSNLLLLSNNSVIHDIFMDYYGNILVKMENNVIFFFKIYSIDTIKLHTWLSEKIKSLFLLSTSGEIHLLEALDNGTIKTAEYPLSLEIQSVAFKAKDTCPFLAFHNNVYNMFYIIDKRDVLKVWAKVVYPENTGVYILVETYGPRILTINEYLFYEIALGFFTKTLLLGFSQSINYEAAEDYFKLQNENTGAVFVNLRPSKYSKACTASQKVFQIAVGCDISKFIRVKGFHKKNCLHHDFSYVIDKSYLRDRPSKNLKVRYAWELYGCPKRLNFTEKFQPVIQLFNENGFIENIVVNFIIWEIHGRDDYSFANTMKQSGCLNEAQTWKSMTTLNNHLPLEEAWGPENYRHCFSYAIGKPGDLDQPYEIINSTNGNHLVWPSDHSGLYVFRVKILDPNYSFCNLTATFAIETYGAIPRPSGYLVAAFIFSLMLLFCSILVLSYFSYLTIYKQCVYDPLHKPQRKSKKK
ncbi:cation channel sperm-associated protein subunit epsilon [Ochotona curzoniae]|uniref:cation channel sperm-associated protein subunit epsilon n=1 Tax=Ochotona curzoniae TaxID=130825 RepID=UPI001B347C11|nr:cation channel sperm-associated protein subunit epsilon [Ochotona curzoniae]